MRANLKQPADVTIVLVKAPTTEVIGLLDELNAALAGPYSEEQRHALPVDRLFRPNIRFFIARLDGEAVACGGVGFYDGFAELKRMYSKPSVRGQMPSASCDVYFHTTPELGLSIAMSPSDSTTA